MLAYRNPSNRVPICFEDTLKLCAYDIFAFGMVPVDVEAWSGWRTVGKVVSEKCTKEE